ncbi:reverse transcriptase domain-containing protein [Tanacetum coccineum]
MGNLLSKSVKMPYNIPFDIQREIIERVPDVKSLIRFRAVSKQWKSFIDSSDFITSYGARPTNHLLLRYNDNHNEVKYLSCVDDEYDTFTQQQHSVTNICGLPKQLHNLKVIGSSHGLLCLRSNSNRKVFALWNPSIGKFVGVVFPDHMPLNSHVTHVSGFMVCPVTNDPTIVMISYPNQILIFTLSSKRWTVIPCSKLPPKSIRLRSSQVVIDRCIYWVVFGMIFDMGGDYRDNYMILSFDLVAKEFRVINIPNSLRNTGSVRFISKLRESLVLFAFNGDFEMPVCGLWKMEHDESFTKLFTISTPDYTINNILGFRKNGELVMLTEKEDEQFATLELYEPCSEHVNNLGISGQMGSFFMESYKETLLLLNHSNGCVYPNLN